MAVVFFCVVLCVTLGPGQIVSGYQKQRPFRVGTSGERNDKPQSLPAKHWPDANDNTSFSNIPSIHKIDNLPVITKKKSEQNAKLIDELQETTSSEYDDWNTFQPNTLLKSIVALELPVPNIPPFAELTIEGTPSQTIPPGKPWAARPEDHEEFSSTSPNHHLPDGSEEITTIELNEKTISTTNQIIGSTTPTKLPKPSRPFFAGQTGGETPPPIVSPEKPWPSRPEESGEFSATSLKPQLVVSSEETTTIRRVNGISMPDQIIGSTKPTKLPKPSRPFFAGQTGGETPPQIIPPGKPWPSRPEEYGEFSATSLEPQLVDSSEETTTIRRVDGISMPNQIIGSTKPPNLPKPSRPFFAGQTGGGTPPQIIPPGKPWPSRPEQYGEFSATSLEPQLVVSSEETTTIRRVDGISMPNQIIGSTKPPELPKPSRPFFAGQTGGGTPPQIIPPGRPWPSRPEEYGQFSATSLEPQLVDSSEETTTIRRVDGISMPNQIIGSTKPPKLPKPSRPFFAGQTGGGTPPQIIPPGRPWPSRPEEYGEFGAPSSKPQIVDRFEETTTIGLEGGNDSLCNQSMGSSRPPELTCFAGQIEGGTPPQIIPPEEPWSSRPGNHGEFSATSLKPQLVDGSEETTTIRGMDSKSMPNQITWSIRPPELPSRPSFAGQTGGGTPPQIIPPGKSWPFGPEYYGEFNATSSKRQIVDRIKETTTIGLDGDSDSLSNQIIGYSRPPALPKHSRPSFAGQTGRGTPPQIIPPGKPWPSRPEDYGEFSATSSKPQIVDRFKETTTIRQEGDSGSISIQIIGSSRPPALPKPNRPSFAGQTGGGTPPQIIPPGKPWPSRPEAYGEFSATSSKPQIVDRFKETTTIRQKGDSGAISNQIIGSSRPPALPKPSRPSFAGQTGGGTPPQIIPPGKPWPARPEGYEEFSATSSKPQIVDRFKETTTIRQEGDSGSISNQIIGSSRPPALPKPSRPSFAGQTGGGTPPQIIPPGKPWPARPEGYEEFSATSSKPQIVDRFKETTTIRQEGDSDSISNQIIGSSRPPALPKPIRPSFAGQTGGGTPPQIIPPGKPWPARPEGYEEFSATSSKPQIVDRFKETTTIRQEGDSGSISNQIIGSSRPPALPKPSRPSFAGQTGGGTPPQIIPPGKPWPARPEGYEEFSATSSKPQIVDRFKETTTIGLNEDSNSISNQIVGSLRPPKLPKPSRPFFAGQTGGGTPPQTIPPGKPWPSRPGNYVELVDSSKETTTMRPHAESNSGPNQIISSSRPPKPSRPSFAGQNGGGTPSQIIQPEPWPSRPENQEIFSSFPQKPQLVDRFKETTTKRLQEGDTTIFDSNMKSSEPPRIHTPSRPSFAGLTGGGVPSQIIPPGEPWPARPEDYLGFHFITYKPQVLDTFKETTTNRLQEGNNLIPDKVISFGSPSKLPAPSRPSFAGLTGGGTPSQIIPPGKPWPARPEDYEGFSVTSRVPQLTDRLKETTKLHKLNISDSSLKAIAPPEKVLPPRSQVSTQSTKPWPTKQAEEMMTKIKDEVFLSKKVSNSKPQVNNLLLLDSPFFRQILKSRNPWHASQKNYEELTSDLVTFRPEENPFTSAPLKRIFSA